MPCLPRPFFLISPTCGLVFLTGKHGGGRDFDSSGLFSHIRIVLILVRGTIKEGDISDKDGVILKQYRMRIPKGKEQEKSCKNVAENNYFQRLGQWCWTVRHWGFRPSSDLVLIKQVLQSPAHSSWPLLSVLGIYQCYGLLIPFGNIYQRLILSSALLSERIKYGGRPDRLTWNIDI